MGQYDRKAQSEPKHAHRSNSGASRAPVVPASGRPGWKGPGFVKKAKQAPRQPPASSASTSTIQEQLLPVELQQLLLNIFRDTFPASNDFETLKPTLQEIKDALFQRDFERAFGREEYLEAYAVRWSPSRTLGYANVLAWICADLIAESRWAERLSAPSAAEDPSPKDKSPAKTVCFGGGAAEIMAFAGLLRYLCPDAAGQPDPVPSDQTGEIAETLASLQVSDEGPHKKASAFLDLHLIDTADWSSVVDKLHTSLTTPPILSKYASATARAANASVLAPGTLRCDLTRADVLDSSIAELRSMIGPEPALLTLLFTLNELYTTSIPKTTAFLLKLTTAAPQGSLLLVVDSPGSYSETAIGDVKEGEEKKKYPMQWLMDHLLLEKGVKKEKDVEPAPAKWEKVVGEDSRWYRLEEGLRYPVSLENMRFQVHLFKRL